jgi:hypothetical protein
MEFGSLDSLKSHDRNLLFFMQLSFFSLPKNPFSFVVPEFICRVGFAGISSKTRYHQLFSTPITALFFSFIFLPQLSYARFLFFYLSSLSLSFNVYIRQDGTWEAW